MACEKGCASCTVETRAQEFIKQRDLMKQINYSFEYDFEKHSKPKHLVLSVTNRCNLSCTYCFVNQNPEDMSYETAVHAIEWLKSNCKEDERPSLSFFGGEPLLKFDDIIKPIVEQYHEEIDFGITTNGLLLDEDIVDFFTKYNVNILLSFDGIAQVQNLQRPAKQGKSFETIIKNIPYLLLRKPNTVMRATLTKASIPYLLESVLMAEKLGFKQITFCPDGYEDWSIEDEKAFEEQLILVGEYIFKGFFSTDSNYLPIRVEPLTKYYTLMMKTEQGMTHFHNGPIRCGLGTTSCGIAPNGDIIPCQERTSKKGYDIGNIFEGIDPIKHENFLNNYLNKLNNFVCDKGCSTKNKLYCLINCCPARFEDLNYQKSSAECAFIRVSSKVAARLRFLCADSYHPNIKYYFQDEGGEIKCLN